MSDTPSNEWLKELKDYIPLDSDTTDITFPTMDLGQRRILIDQSRFLKMKGQDLLEEAYRMRQRGLQYLQESKRYEEKSKTIPDPYNNNTKIPSPGVSSTPSTSNLGLRPGASAPQNIIGSGQKSAQGPIIGPQGALFSPTTDLEGQKDLFTANTKNPNNLAGNMCSLVSPSAQKSPHAFQNGSKTPQKTPHMTYSTLKGSPTNSWDTPPLVLSPFTPPKGPITPKNNHQTLDSPNSLSLNFGSQDTTLEYVEVNSDSKSVICLDENEYQTEREPFDEAEGDLIGIIDDMLWQREEKEIDITRKKCALYCRNRANKDDPEWCKKQECWRCIVKNWYTSATIKSEENGCQSLGSQPIMPSITASMTASIQAPGSKQIMASEPIIERTQSSQTTHPISTGPHAKGPEATGINSTGPQTTSPEATVSYTKGPNTTDFHTKSPHTTEPQAMSPQAIDPKATLPQATSPYTMGPQTTSPEATGPYTKGPITTDFHTTIPHTTDTQAMSPQATDSKATVLKEKCPQAMSPYTTGPESTGPHTTDSQAMSPQAIDTKAIVPQAIGFEAMGSHITDPHATGLKSPKAANELQSTDSRKRITPKKYDFQQNDINSCTPPEKKPKINEQVQILPGIQTPEPGSAGDFTLGLPLFKNLSLRPKNMKDFLVYSNDFKKKERVYAFTHTGDQSEISRKLVQRLGLQIFLPNVELKSNTIPEINKVIKSREFTIVSFSSDDTPVQTCIKNHILWINDDLDCPWKDNDSDDSDDEEKEPMALVFGKDLDFFFEKKREIFVPHPFTRIFTNSFGQFIHFMD